MKLSFRKGVSIISLVLVIIIMIIISSTSVITLSVLKKNSKRVTFAKDLTTIKDKSVEYYAVYGDLPISELTDAKIYTSTQFVNEVNTINTSLGEILSSEITKNSDTNETFYEVDLTKIDLKSTARGFKEDGDSDDVYLITGETHHVYYLKGYKVGRDRYFSNVNIESE